MAVTSARIGKPRSKFALPSRPAMPTQPFPVLVMKAMWNREFSGYSLSSNETLLLMCLAGWGGVVRIEGHDALQYRLGMSPLVLRSSLWNLRREGFIDYLETDRFTEIWTHLPCKIGFPWNDEHGRRRLRGEGARS